MIQEDSTQLKIIDSGSQADCIWADIAIVGTQTTGNQSFRTLLLQQYPSLPQHACKSGSSTQHETFGEHLAGALLPHVAEHVAIDILVAKYPGESFAGNTSWIAREDQTMRVRISLTKEEAFEYAVYRSHGALSEAIMQINRLLSMC